MWNPTDGQGCIETTPIPPDGRNQREKKKRKELNKIHTYLHVEYCIYIRYFEPLPYLGGTSVVSKILHLIMVITTIIYTS